MSQVGFQRDRAEQAAVKAGTAKPWRSGFCNPSNDTASHERCKGANANGNPCICSCHHQTPASEETAPSSATEVPSQPGTQDVESSPAPRSPGFYDEIPEADYHADTTSLSVSGAKTLLKAPALYQWEREHPVFKKAFDFGSAAHALVLGRGMESIYVAPFDSWRTKVAQTEQATAHADGLSPILPKDWSIVCDMADRLASHTLAMRLLSEGQPEVSAYALDEPTGVMRRGRFDWLGATILTDYKTTVCADPDVWRRKDAAAYRYYMQAAWYLDLARDLGHPAQAFAFIVQEKTPPYLVSVIELDRAALTRGRELNRRALERFRDCTAVDLWPGYIADTTFASVSLPGWAYTDNTDDDLEIA